MHENFQQLKMKSFHMLKVIGLGSFAQVWEAFDEVNNITVAVKVIPKYKIRAQKIRHLLQSEIAIMKRINKSNPNVIRFIDNFVCSQSVFIVMEYCPEGTLQGLLQKEGKFQEEKATYYLKEIINGFKGLHEINVIHRDFKAQNVLVTKGVPKIADLGFAKMLNHSGDLAQTILGTSVTMAPEVLEGKSYGLKADIWSLGVVYYQFLFGRYPFYGKDDNQIKKAIKKPPSFEGTYISPKAKDFILRCLTYDPLTRISWAELYRHPLITSVQKTVVNIGQRNKLQKNVDFYQKNSEIKEINIKELGFSSMAEVEMQKMMMNEYQNANLKNKEKKEIQSAIQIYKAMYLEKYNSILFVYQHIVPYIPSIIKMAVNHVNYLFILSKKTYFDLLEFNSLLKGKKDFMDLHLHFEAFVNSTVYGTIQKMLEEMLQITKMQMEEYESGLKDVEPKFLAEMDSSELKSTKQVKFIKEMLLQYEYLLMDGLDIFNGQQKNHLILTIEAVAYLQRVKGDNYVSAFQRYLNKLSLKNAEALIRKKQEDHLKKFYW